MNITITQSINISLNWDYLDDRSRNREEGTFHDEEFIIEEEQYTIIADLYARVITDYDSGDYWNPPCSDVLDEEFEVYDVRVFDLEDEEIILSDQEKYKLINEIIDSIEYE